MGKILFGILALQLVMLAATADASCVGSLRYKGKTWYVDVLTSGSSGTVWLRSIKNACSKDDIKYMTLSVRKDQLGKVASTVCRAKKIYDSGKTVVGCAATVGSFVCGTAAVPSSGASVVACSGVIAYTADTGFANCIEGLSDGIASVLGYSKEWSGIRAVAGVSSGQFITAIDKAIDVGCEDLKRR